MNIYPAIDLFEGKAVRLYQGDYRQMTVYSEDPLAVAADFVSQGAECVHLVDLEGARDGGTPNWQIIREIAARFSLFTEVGGGVRSRAVIEKYLEAGIDRIILGTAAVRDPMLLDESVRDFGEHIAVGVDVRDGKVSVKGWTEEVDCSPEAFCRTLSERGVHTVICTEIAHDGAMQGAAEDLYKRIASAAKVDLIASGGIRGIEDVKRLKAQGLYGAIIGKAYYTGAVNLREAIEAAR